MISKKPTSPIHRHLEAAFTTGFKSPPRPRALRTSSLPYCPILDCLPKEEEYWTLHSQYYTTVGTDFHSGVQAFMSLVDDGPRMWGRWKCPTCDHRWTKPVFRPAACPNRCNEPPLYDEVEFRVGPLTGHCDFVAMYGGKFGPHLAGKPDVDWASLGGQWVLHDFKTTGKFGWWLPKSQHLLQLRTYALLLMLNYRIRIDGYSVIYVARTDLEYEVFGPYSPRRSLQQTRDWTFRAIAGFKAATQLRKAAAVTANPDDVLVRAVVRQRPCRCKSSHDEYMGREYNFSKEPCPLLSYCSRGDHQAARMLRAGLPKPIKRKRETLR